MGERVGIMGGSFDPVHVGHIAAAVTVRHAMALDVLHVVVAGDQWQKRGRVVASAEDRLDLVRAAVEDLDRVVASSIEIDRGRPSYTHETLEELTAPGRELFLVLGADAARNTGTWVEVARCQELATLVVVSRAGDPGEPADPDGWRWTNVTIPWLDVSSTDIRARLASGWPIDGLVPSAAVRRIRERGLYTDVPPASGT
jgi:nicotinate-nucleotide adenylyltransferase